VNQLQRSPGARKNLRNKPLLVLEAFVTCSSCSEKCRVLIDGGQCFFAAKQPFFMEFRMNTPVLSLVSGDAIEKACPSTVARAGFNQQSDLTQ
jgi:hypothetical protein